MSDAGPYRTPNTRCGRPTPRSDCTPRSAASGASTSAANASDMTIDAPGYEPTEVTVDVADGGCGVAPEAIDVPMVGSPCSDALLPSAFVDVIDASGPIDADVTYVAGGADPAACDRIDVGRYSCGWAAAGDLHITADSPDYPAARADLAVEQGECHVITGSVTIDVTR